MNPFLRWLLSEVKCSRSQFLLEITGEGKVVPVSLRGSKQRTHSWTLRTGDMLSLIHTSGYHTLVKQPPELKTAPNKVRPGVKLSTKVKVCFWCHFTPSSQAQKTLAVLWGGLSSKDICSAGLESVYAGIEWVIISRPIMITSDHSRAPQWLTAESAKLPPICAATKHWLVRESNTEERTKRTWMDTEEGKAVGMKRGGDEWKRWRTKKGGGGK